MKTGRPIWSAVVSTSIHRAEGSEDVSAGGFVSSTHRSQSTRAIVDYISRALSYAHCPSNAVGRNDIT